MTSGSMACDVLIIGHGAAGCLAGAELARQGREVIIIGRGTPATEMSTARIMLPGGRQGKELRERLKALGPAYGLYALPPRRTVAFTALGTIVRQDLISAHDWIEEDIPLAVVGLRGNQDLDPDLVCRSLHRRRPSMVCRPYWTDLGLPGSVDCGRDRLSRQAVDTVEVLGSALRDLQEEAVVLPPLFTGSRFDDALGLLERKSGRIVREPVTPLSNPGRRLQACLENEATTVGCRLLKGREVIGLEVRGATVRGATVRSGLRDISIRFDAAILASGGLVSGGLTVMGDEVIDPLGLFSISSDTEAMLRSPALTSALSKGIAHREGRAVLVGGKELSNVLVIGSARPGLALPLGQGLGHVMCSALQAARRPEVSS
jgi:anaerobic glycerol-3-phosphate dehydrogenase